MRALQSNSIGVGKKHFNGGRKMEEILDKGVEGISSVSDRDWWSKK